MTLNRKSFNELEEELLAKTEARGCKPITVTGYRYLCNSVIDQLRNWGYEAYTKGGGDLFVKFTRKNANKIEEYIKN